MVYYYDPAQAVERETGAIKAPRVVYNAEGRAIPLESLKARQVLMEAPPMSMIHHNITANPNSTANVNWTHPNVITERIHRAGSVLSDIPAANAATDQSIVVATVGIMALLVGAVSARRLRARSLLSACIENESLHDDAAYDTAYTSSADTQSYHTFSWKQDLEKFDV